MEFILLSNAKSCCETLKEWEWFGPFPLEFTLPTSALDLTVVMYVSHISNEMGLKKKEKEKKGLLTKIIIIIK